MKRINLLRVVTAVSWLIATDRTAAQFYAPETEFHDFAQRTFVVESARVLAWRENLDAPRIHEITYRVTAKTDRTTEWELSWLDAQGKTLQQARVSYPEAPLEEGPNFYRAVFGQLWKVGWKQPGSCSGSDLVERFWSAAEGAGVSREEGQIAAFRFMEPKSSLETGENAPRMAGLLVHASLPALAGAVTLDSVLLGRAAAWLCLAEVMLQNSSNTNNALWSPMMFLSGRENAARELWKEYNRPATEYKHPLVASWDFFLRDSSTKEAFLFAARREMRPYAMPMLVYHSRVAHVESTLIELLEPLFDDKNKTLQRLYSYGPFFAENGGVAGGRIAEGFWTVLSRQAWLHMLNEYPRQALDYDGYVPALNEAVKASKQIDLVNGSIDDLSLLGFPATARLVNLGHKEGLGKLIPVATVTARDLLNYGWESTGLHMGTRHNFIKDMWGVPKLAEPILEAVTREIDGLGPFFAVPPHVPTNRFVESLYRLQLVDNMNMRLKVNAHPFEQVIGNPEAARLFYRRCWLRPQQVRWQSGALAKSGAFDEVESLVRKYHAHCGHGADFLALQYLLDSKEGSQFRGLKWHRELTEELGESLPPSHVWMNALVYKRYWDRSGFKRAQQQEKFFWQFPDSRVHRRVFREYILAGAFKAAKRFYLQMHDIVEDRVDFSNSMGAHCYLMAFQSGDRELMEIALRDSSSGSYQNMLMLIWDCAFRDDIDEMELRVQDLIDRYESGRGPDSVGNRLKAFVPLIPALKDPKHADRDKALDFLGKAPTGTVLRWILIKKYQMGTEDAIRFLGGTDTDSLRNVMVAYLKRDKDEVGRAWVKFWNPDMLEPAQHVLPIYLYHETTGTKIPDEEIDLKPADATTIKQAVLKLLNKE